MTYIGLGGITRYELGSAFDFTGSGTRIVFYLPRWPMALGSDWSGRTGVAAHTIHAWLAGHDDLAGVDYQFDRWRNGALWLIAHFTMRQPATMPPPALVLAIG